MKPILKVSSKVSKRTFRKSWMSFGFADKSKVNNVQFMTTKSMKMV